MNKKLYSEEQVLEAMKFASSHLSSMEGINRYFATLTPEPSSSDLIDRKEVENILREMVETQKELIKAKLVPTRPTQRVTMFCVARDRIAALEKELASLPSASAVEDNTNTVT